MCGGYRYQKKIIAFIPDFHTIMYASFWIVSIKKIKIPDGVVNISDSVFYKCMGLINIIIPESINTIGDGAFMNCEVM